VFSAEISSILQNNDENEVDYPNNSAINSSFSISRYPAISERILLKVPIFKGS
jgi:hypothetical protein